MWRSYFTQIQKKYCMKISTKLPLVVCLDGKNITKNKDINILDNYKGSFLNVFGECAQWFTEKYGGYAIFGNDEISFIFDNPKIVINDFVSEEENYSNEIVSLFSQHFFDLFSMKYKEKIFWHGECFSIPEQKIKSYIKYRSRAICNVNITKFLIKHNKYNSEKRLNERIEDCKKIDQFNYIADIVEGTLYFNGKKIDLQEFFNGNIRDIEDSKNGKSINVEDFEIEIEI